MFPAAGVKRDRTLGGAESTSKKKEKKITPMEKLGGKIFVEKVTGMNPKSIFPSNLDEARAEFKSTEMVRLYSSSSFHRTEF